ncbi:MAG: hypothetical protein ABR579_07370 [Actinomycetota bacterium]|nr:hypothetical protein [Actinomycetota bacterium]
MKDTTLPKRLADELARTSRRGLAEEAQRWMEKALRARDEGRAPDARRAAVRAKQAAPRSPAVREALGLAAYELGEWHEAAQELLAARRMTGRRNHDPVIADAYVRLGRATRALDFLADLGRNDVPERVWIDAQVVRARAFASRGLDDSATSVLVRAARDAGPTARARLAEAGRELGQKRDA